MDFRFRSGAFVLLAAVLRLAAPVPAVADGPLAPLARPGVWPGVGNLIAFDGRMWFVNSAPFKDTNAADIYSYDPPTGALRYERGLFTQDAGVPTVLDGKLFWPFEDPRLNMGAGEYAATDGRAWRWRRMPEGSAMHLHAMAACGGELVAVSGGWEGQLQVSRDRGRTWRLAATYPNGEARFSRLVAVTPFDGRCFVGASAEGRHGGKLLEWVGGRLVPVPGWPETDGTDGLTVHDGRLFAWTDSGGTQTLLAFDGKRTASVSSPPSNRLRALASDGTYLWAVSGGNGAGALWRSRDAAAWTEIQRFEEMPISVRTVAGAVFVGTYREDGGALWGPPVAVPPLGMAATRFDEETPNEGTAAHAPEAATEIDRIVSGDVEIKGGVRQLRGAFQRLAEISDPALGRHLAALYPNVGLGGDVRMFTDHRVPQADLTRWYMLGTMAVNGHGRVPPEILSLPVSSRRTRAEKYFDLPIAGIATVGWVGQNDPETIAALIERLDRKQDPKWLRADIVAALVALTGERFGHDAGQWRAWWNNR